MSPGTPPRHLARRPPSRSRRHGAAALVAAAVALASCRQPAPAPNVVLISIDTLRSDALRAYDPAAAALPAIDGLAAGSRRFSHALAAASWTLPSHASLLTGVYPHRHGAIHRRATISRGVPSLPALLAARGYETVAFTDGGFLDASYGFGRGFLRYDDHLSRGVAPLPWLPQGGRPDARGESDLFARAAAFLAHRSGASRPLFLFAHSYAVHDYYKAHPWARAATGARVATTADHNLQCLTGERQCPAAEWQTLAGYYRAELRRLDDGVARLLATVHRQLGDRATYVVLLSDHGEGLEPGEGATHHGGALRRDLLSVPLLVAGPGIAPGVESTPVSLIDVAPTLAALAGAGNADFDGSSLLPLLHGGPRASLAALSLGTRELHAEEHYYWWRDGRRRAARDVGTHALAVGVLRTGWWYTRAPHRELAERLDGTAAGAPPLAVLRQAASPLLRMSVVATPPHRESEELEATLRSLGYDGGTP